MIYEMLCSFRKQLTYCHGMLAHTSIYFVFVRSWVQILTRKLEIQRSIYGFHLSNRVIPALVPTLVIAASFHLNKLSHHTTSIYYDLLRT